LETHCQNCNGRQSTSAVKLIIGKCGDLTFLDLIRKLLFQLQGARGSGLPLRIRAAQRRPRRSAAGLGY
jgi:hypothetical protein